MGIYTKKKILSEASSLMKDSIFCENLKDISRLVTVNDIVVEVNNRWVDLTGYQESEVINHSVEEIFVQMLSVNSTFLNVLEVDGKKTFFIFTKENSAREVYIHEAKVPKLNLQVYFLIEKEYSRIEHRFMHLEHEIKENRVGIAIYSCPDLTLLRASGHYFDFVSGELDSHDTIVGKKMCKFTPKWELVENFWENRLKSKEDLLMNETFINGKYWDASFSPIPENGKTKYYVVYVTECTDRVMHRKRLETQTNIINDQKEELEAILENMSDILTIIDKYGNYTKMNGGALKLDPEILVAMLGKYSKNKLCYNEVGEELPPAALPIYKIMEGKAVTNSRISIKTAETEVVYDVNGTPVLDNEGNFKFGILCSHDVSNLVNQVKTIDVHKKELESLIENINEAIFIMKDGKPYLQNRLAREWFLEKAIGIEALEIANFHDADDNLLTYDKLPSYRLLKGDVIENEKIVMRYHSKEKQTRVMRINGTPVYDNQNNMISCFISIRDVTEDEKKEELYKEHREKLLMIETEKAQDLEKILKMKEEFLATISHEFKTPLTVINAILQTLEKFYADQMSDKVKGYLRKIRQNSFRQLRLVNNLVDITRVNSEQFKIHKINLDVVFITSTIIESVQSFAIQKGVQLSFSSTISSKVIGIDESIYERILLNLLSNAIKFTPQGKSIYVELEIYKNNVIVKVRDEGIGIPEDKQNMIFERFGQVDSSLSRQAEGSGIGLSLVKTLVTALKGDIKLKSDITNGSTFKVSLPADLIYEDIEQTRIYYDIDKRLIQTANIEFSDIYLG